ncbi:hypothetical protein [Fluviispira multicolorata]|uniref:Uncharacterized protein n=1 Tax=Fluviispira multicolorata TaxID=2654512 RepID=A0A833JD44_9BACT|nr:hypothetical protein [Fluviispira multicolorata]KAB8031068.1 hypothetical protein GCL57_08865 [Fluviispira multicolorata]
MNSFIISMVCIFLLLFSQKCFSIKNSESNFILISNSQQKSKYIDYRMPDSDSIGNFSKIPSKVQKQYPKMAPLYLFYNDENIYTKSNINILAYNSDILFLINNEKNVLELGKIIHPSDEKVQSFLNSISNSKIVAAYWEKKSVPAAIMLDKKGVVYLVKRSKSHDISIEQLGLSNISFSANP